MLWLIGNVGGIIGLVSRLNSPKKLNYSKVYLANLTIICFTPLSAFPPIISVTDYFFTLCDLVIVPLL